MNNMFSLIFDDFWCQVYRRRKKIRIYNTFDEITNIIFCHTLRHPVYCSIIQYAKQDIPAKAI